jgi:predicted transcriptional regulator
LISIKQRWVGEMADESTPQKVVPGMVAEIVASYVTQNSIGVDQIAGLIATVHRTLSGLGTNAPASVAEALTPAVPIRRSVQPDHVICLECGFRGKTLRRHLRTAHGLEAAGYRARWRLSADHALVAPAYSAHRSAMAKELGLGRKPASVETPPAPQRRGRPRRAVAE